MNPEPELNFARIKREINLMDLALSLGYQHNREKSGPSLEKGKFHVFDYRGKKELDQIVVSQAPSGDYLYFNRNDDRDRGTVIDFIKFRVENPRVDAITATPGKSVWANVIENARRFLNLPPQEQHRSAQLQKQTEPVQKGDRPPTPLFLRKIAGIG